MKKCLIALGVCALLMSAFSTSHAQVALRGGMGLIFEHSQFGGHTSIIIPFSSKPAGAMISAEYYKEGNVTTIPVSVRGLYRLSVDDRTSLYMGAGTGFIYAKVEGGGISISDTEALGTAVVGVNKRFSGPTGIFAELSVDRALVSDANNNFAVKAGVSFTLSE